MPTISVRDNENSRCKRNAKKTTTTTIKKQTNKDRKEQGEQKL